MTEIGKKSESHEFSPDFEPHLIGSNDIILSNIYLRLIQRNNISISEIKTEKHITLESSLTQFESLVTPDGTIIYSNGIHVAPNDVICAPSGVAFESSQKVSQNKVYSANYPEIEFQLPGKLQQKPNAQIAADVLGRLLFRHSILENLEKIESEYEASKRYIPARPSVKHVKAEAKSTDTSPKAASPYATDVAAQPSLPPAATPDPSELNFVPWTDVEIASARALRSYKLATTDLFVEKAIAFLEEDYRHYVIKSNWLFLLAFIAIVIGIIVSYVKLNELESSWHIIAYAISRNDISWFKLVSGFIKSFTFYGFIVLFAVFCVRLGKAMVDQAERLRERRHSLRQGRLYIHLSNGEVTVEDLEKAFDWNVTKGNAFGNMPTEASAPWGSVIKEALKAIPEAFKKVKGSS